MGRNCQEGAQSKTGEKYCRVHCAERQGALPIQRICWFSAEGAWAAALSWQPVVVASSGSSLQPRCSVLLHQPSPASSGQSIEGVHDWRWGLWQSSEDSVYSFSSSAVQCGGGNSKMALVYSPSQVCAVKISGADVTVTCKCRLQSSLCMWWKTKSASCWQLQIKSNWTYLNGSKIETKPGLQH